jgi:hypothetical protein
MLHMCEHFCLYIIHQLRKHATYPIAHFWLRPLRLTFVSLTLAFTETSLSSRLALLLLLARLAERPLGHVQSPFLGLSRPLTGPLKPIKDQSMEAIIGRGEQPA